MTKDVLELMARYNQVANDRMDKVIQTLSPQEWDKNLGGFFKSVREVCSHMYICDVVYMQRFAALREFKINKDNFLDKTYTFKDVLFSDMKEYFPKRIEMNKRLIDFCSEITEDDLSKMLSFTNSRGEPTEKNFGGTVLHFFNHSTHHRGMISVYLEILGKENDFNSLLLVV